MKTILKTAAISAKSSAGEMLKILGFLLLVGVAVLIVLSILAYATKNPGVLIVAAFLVIFLILFAVNWKESKDKVAAEEINKEVKRTFEIEKEMKRRGRW